MKKNLALPIAIFIIIVLAGIILILLPSQEAIAPTNNGTNNGNGATTTQNGTDVTEGSETAGIPDLILVGTPTKNMKITSPLTITGSARGFWYFEANFPVELKDANGTTIAQHYAEAQSEWMTEDFVLFKSTLTFPAQPAGSKGTLILHKSNASGEPERDQSVSIPVTF